MTLTSKTARAGRALLCVALLCVMWMPASVSAADPAAVQREMNKLAADYGKLESEQAKTEAKIVKLESDLKNADRIMAEKSEAMRSRAGYLYKNGGASSYLDGLMIVEDLGVFVRKVQLLQMAGDRDTEVVETLEITRGRAGEIRENLQRTRSSQKALKQRMQAKRRELEAKLKSATGAAKVAAVGKFSGFVLPMVPSAFANTWGAPRSGGRRHKGTDVMAPCGARVLAVTDGVISNLHRGGNGGIMLYLRANSGDVFFYAHLKGYASGISTGTRVSAGQLVGYNGNTGNARGGPCHVHFEWHPGGGRPVNPYPLLARAR